jgi:hypothetical protein
MRDREKETEESLATINKPNAHATKEKLKNRPD